MRRWGLAAAVAALVAATGALGQNLLTNSGCESGGDPPAGWTQTNSPNNWYCANAAATQYGEPPTGLGPLYFYAGVGVNTNAWTEIHQNVALPAGATGVRFEALLNMYDSGPPDSGRMRLVARNSGGAPIGDVSTGTMNTPAVQGNYANTYQNKILTFDPLPAGTTSVDAVLGSYYCCGSQANTYFDQVQLSPIYPATTGSTGTTGTTDTTGTTGTTGSTGTTGTTDTTGTTGTTGLAPLPGVSSNAVRIVVTHDVDFATEWPPLEAGWPAHLEGLLFPAGVMTGQVTLLRAVAGSVIATADVEALTAANASGRALGCFSYDAALSAVNDLAAAGGAQAPNVINVQILEAGSGVPPLSVCYPATTGNPTTGLPPSAPAPAPSPSAASAGDESGEETPFPWWWIVVAAAACCLLCLIVVAAIYLSRRKKGDASDDGSSTAEVEMNGDDEEDAEVCVYDAIVGKVGADGDLVPISQVVAGNDGTESNYARIPTREAVEGAYARIPKLSELSATVTVLDPAEIMIDTSKTVGKGAFGDVFRGNYRGVDIAVKALRDDYSDEQLQSFFDEADVISKIPAHEHVIGFLGATPDPFLIVTEFAGQGSLSRFLRSRKTQKLTTEQMIKIIRDVAAGMAHLHSHSIVHRDLAARNVLLTNQLVPKIADFGMSRIKEAESDAHHSKSASGPVRWMAIESIRKGTFSEASDVWSFAVTAWEVVSQGATPYGRREANIEVARQVIKGRRLEFPDIVPDSVADLMGECMAAKPEHRPTFAAIVASLDAGGDDDVIYASLSTFAGYDAGASAGTTALAALRDEE